MEEWLICCWRSIKKGEVKVIKEYPILEFDPSRSAVIEPEKYLKNIGLPESAVICFFNDVINDLVSKGLLTKLYELRSEIGAHPIYEMNFENKKVTVFHPCVGAPIAAGLMEEVIALGSRKFIACGGAGVLDKSITVGHVLVPYAAVRDEGTSYHYAAPSREIELDRDCVDKLVAVLEKHKCENMRIKTWTTDAMFRETVDKVKLRKEEGCLAVEMECSALTAVAQFRGVKFAQFLYAGDDVSCDEWDAREWNSRTDIREKLFMFAVEASLEL
jgi:uridine phosphorylase